MAEIGSSQRAQLPGALLAVTAEQHPHVLHRRTGSGVIHVDKMRAWPCSAGYVQRGPQNIAWMAVTVQANQVDGAVFMAVLCIWMI